MKVLLGTRYAGDRIHTHMRVKIATPNNMDLGSARKLASLFVVDFIWMFRPSVQAVVPFGAKNFDHFSEIT